MASAAHALPPVQTSGKISSTYRVNKPSDGSDVQALTNTFEYGANSYIWQPWFGVWRARAAISRADTDTEETTGSEIFTGDVEVNLFHRSHFPFSAFVGIRDSRVEIDNLSEALSDVRVLRVGLTQQYQDIPNSAYYLGSYNRDEQEDLRTGANTVSDRLLLSADKRGEQHSFNVVVTSNQTTSNIADSQTTANQATLAHNYRPNQDLSISNSANVSVVDSSSDLFSSEASAYGVASQAEWRPSDERWRVRGDVAFTHEELEIFGQSSEFQDHLRGRASARYELSDQASVFAEVGLDRRQTSGGDQLVTFQGISGTYNADPVGWRGYDYAWGASAGIGNQTNSEEGNVLSQTASANHSLTRTWTPTLYGNPTPVVFNAGQEVRFVNDNEDGAQTQIVHRATLSASQATQEGTGYGQLSMFDVRTFGVRDSGVFAINAALTYVQPLSRYRSIDAVGSYNFTSSTSDGVDVQRDVVSAEIRYRDSRLFDVTRLSFETSLRMGATGVLAQSDDTGQINFEWDNRIGYTIGLLEIDARFGATQFGDRRNLLFLITTTRRF